MLDMIMRMGTGIHTEGIVMDTKKNTAMTDEMNTTDICTRTEDTTMPIRTGITVTTGTGLGRN
jgi:hypothetical protein